MKHKNLELLSSRGINVPKFTVLRSGDTADLSFSDAELFAVRSSFSAEDDNDASFAGQFDTFLNVKREDVPKMAVKVAESAKSATVKAYQSAKSVESSGEMHVIIQEMVDAELSGVVFTANPIGILNETVIVVGEGLGTNVVEDKVFTTSYFYNRDDDLYYYERQEDSPLLDESVLESLIEITEKIRDILGYHADIEYAVKEGEVYILQARPITTLSIKDSIILDNSNIVESYPGVSLPLTQDYVKEIYYGIFRRLVERITKDESLVFQMDRYLRDMVDVANWRIYYRISNWYAVLKLLPFSKKIIPIWQKMLGVSNTFVSSPDDIKVPFATKCTVLFSFLHYIHVTPRVMDDLNRNFEERFLNYKTQLEHCDGVDELLGVYADIKENVLSDWDLTLINDMYTFIYTALAGKRNKESLADVKNLESMKPVLAINDLAECARSSGLDSSEYRTKASEYIDRFGDRCLGELKLETETYRTSPDSLDEYIRGRLCEEPVAAFDEALLGKRDSFFMKRAKLGIRNREISRMNRSRIFGLAREIFLRIGDCLVKNGSIDDRRDVFYLRMDELCTDTDLRDTVLSRKAEKDSFEKVSAYSRLVFAEKVVNKASPTLTGGVLHTSDLLCGTPSSGGKVEGEVLLIEAPDDKLDTTGKILVTRSTDPGWVFLIQRAAGIVAEKGSLLSHTAIISRELHKPAVVGVKDCTKLLKSGDRVELDAYLGTIKKL